MMRSLLLVPFFLISLSACAQNVAADPNTSVSSPPMAMPNEPIAVPVMPGPDACNPPTSLIGQSKKVLETMKFKGPVRIIGPNDMVTMDYSPQRLNIVYDKNGIIREVKCG
jgi:hypothetical protein